MSSAYCKRLVSRTIAAAAATVCVLGAASRVFADPPDRVARISIVNGAVSFRPASADDWDAAIPNYPLTIGDQLWSDRTGRSEIDLGSAAVRISALTDLNVVNLDDRSAYLRVTSGTVNVHLRDGWRDAFQLEMPNGVVSLLMPGTYRIDVSPDSDLSTVTVRRGQATVVAGGYSYQVHAQESVELSGVDMPRTRLRDAVASDAFEDWCLARDRREDSSLTARYVPEDVVGYSDLDDYGTWTTAAEYGPVWMPRVSAGWAPYRDGRWVWIDPWGWTWVDGEPWGFAPFHYGRWVSMRGGWGWVPGRFAERERPVYAPALVAFVGGPGWSASLSFGSEPVGWFPLGPREPYVPAYRVSQRYVHAINVPHVNVVDVNVRNINYVNRLVPGAVTAVPRDAFLRSRPVSSVAVAVPRESVQGATVVGHAAPIAPQATVREARPRVAAPPPAIANRPFVGRRQAPGVPPQVQPRAPAQQPVIPPQAPAQQREQPRREQPPPQGQQPQRAQPPQDFERRTRPQPQDQQPQREQPKAQPRQEQPQAQPPQREQPRAQPRQEQPQAQPPQREQPRAQPRQEQPQAQPPQDQQRRARPAPPQREQPRAQPRQEQPQAQPKAAPRDEKPRDEKPRDRKSQDEKRRDGSK